MWRKKRRKKKNRDPIPPANLRLEGDLPSSGHRWYNEQIRGRGNIPPGLAGASAYPEFTLAWIRATCKLAAR
jgi:hypothetical protein